MNKLAGFLAGVLRDLTRSRARLVEENAFLRAQLQALKAQTPRPRLDAYDRDLLVFLSNVVPRWRQLLVVVTPETLIRWSKEGFQPFWARLSRRGRKKRGKLFAETRERILDLVTGTNWGAKRIVGELAVKFGIRVHKKTVEKVLKKERTRRPSGQSWRAFLENHVSATWASDFFTVPTLWFGQLYVFFVMRLDTREILHWNVTWHPTSQWTVQQLKNVLAWSGSPSPRFFIRDRDDKYGALFDEIAKGAGIEVLHAASPLENAHAERFVGSARREALRHFWVIGEKHLRWIMGEFIPYYNRRRVHQGIDQQVPGEIENSVERARRGPVVREEFLNGLLVEYRRAA